MIQGVQGAGEREGLRQEGGLGREHDDEHGARADRMIHRPISSQNKRFTNIAEQIASQEPPQRPLKITCLL